MDSENNGKNTDLIIPSEIVPDVVPIIPISQRPLFPGMMIPLVLTGEKMLQTINAILETESKIGGAVLVREQTDTMGHRTTCTMSGSP